jgi:hypothetical protein
LAQAKDPLHTLLVIPIATTIVSPAYSTPSIITTGNRWPLKRIHSVEPSLAGVVA